MEKLEHARVRGAPSLDPTEDLRRPCTSAPAAAELARRSDVGSFKVPRSPELRRSPVTLAREACDVAPSFGCWLSVLEGLARRPRGAIGAASAAIAAAAATQAGAGAGFAGTVDDGGGGGPELVPGARPPGTARDTTTAAAPAARKEFRTEDGGKAGPPAATAAQLVVSGNVPTPVGEVGLSARRLTVKTMGIFSGCSSEASSEATFFSKGPSKSLNSFLFVTIDPLTATILSSGTQPNLAALESSIFEIFTTSGTGVYSDTPSLPPNKSVTRSSTVSSGSARGTMMAPNSSSSSAAIMTINVFFLFIVGRALSLRVPWRCTCAGGEAGEALPEDCAVAGEAPPSVVRDAWRNALEALAAGLAPDGTGNGTWPVGASDVTLLDRFLAEGGPLPRAPCRAMGGARKEFLFGAVRLPLLFRPLPLA